MNTGAIYDFCGVAVAVVPRTFGGKTSNIPHLLLIGQIIAVDDKSDDMHIEFVKVVLVVLNVGFCARRQIRVHAWGI